VDEHLRRLERASRGGDPDARRRAATERCRLEGHPEAALWIRALDAPPGAPLTWRGTCRRCGGELGPGAAPSALEATDRIDGLGCGVPVLAPARPVRDTPAQREVGEGVAWCRQRRGRIEWLPGAPVRCRVSVRHAAGVIRATSPSFVDAYRVVRALWEGPARS
jgi:hypothetical protein